MRRNISNILWGAIFIFVGVGLVGNILDLWDYTVFFNGWWTLFLIIPALVSMIQSGIKLSNSIIMGIGILLLLDQQDVIPEGIVFKFAAPIVLIVIGIAIISKAAFRHNAPDQAKTDGKTTVNTDDYPNYFAIFSGNTVKNNSMNFQGGNATSVFGGNEIDLSDVVLAKDVDFGITSIFGGTEIKAPKNARIELRGVPIFGGNDNTAASSADPAAFKITFHCTSIFGGTEIK
ncbi:MAG: LiaF transmembrane domain-containing protein [Saccharofermentanales bacterium]